MTPWDVQIAKPARKDLQGLSASDLSAVLATLERLGREPFGEDIKKLKDASEEWRLRIGR